MTKLESAGQSVPDADAAPETPLTDSNITLRDIVERVKQELAAESGQGPATQTKPRQFEAKAARNEAFAPETRERLGSSYIPISLNDKATEAKDWINTNGERSGGRCWRQP